jgi:hypothetical protein
MLHAPPGEMASREGVAQTPLLSALFVRRVADDSGMAQNFLRCDRDQSLLLPPDLRDWLDEDHLAWFVIEAIEDSTSRPSTPPTAPTATGARPTTRR